MIVAHWLKVGSLHPLPAKFDGYFKKPLNLLLSPHVLRYSSLLNSQFSSKASLKCSCSKNEVTDKPSKGFPALASDSPWESGSVWSTMGLYMFSLHIPLSFGGLSVVAQILHQPVLEPQTEISSLLGLQILELSAMLLILVNTMKPHFELKDLFKVNNSTKERNWLLAATLGFGFLILLVFLSSVLADRLFGPKDVNNPILKEILLSGDVSKVATVLVYCVVTPLLEEIVYRGFLLRTLSYTMKWQEAIIISSAVFSAAHFSGLFSILQGRLILSVCVHHARVISETHSSKQNLSFLFRFPDRLSALACWVVSFLVVLLLAFASFLD